MLPIGSHSYDVSMPHFHVSSTLNRDSIRRFGLDWTRMSAAPGIAGSGRPEVEGIFLCRESEGEVDWFIEMNNTGGPVDVWRIDGITADSLVERHGLSYYPAPIEASQLTLVLTDLSPGRRRH